MTEDNQRLVHCFFWAIVLVGGFMSCSAIAQDRADECRAKGGEPVYVYKSWLCLKRGTVVE